MARERRFLPTATLPIEIEERADKPPKISGYAAVFYDGSAGTEYQMWKGFSERIMPGAFDRCIREGHDVRALFNHDPNYPLGRTSAGTCRLSIDKRGLKYEIDPPNSTIGKDVAEALRRGDVSGSSFSFSMQGGESVIREQGETEIREITDVGQLYDVGPVTFPAYEGTSAYSRSEDVDEVRRQLEGEHIRRRAEKEAAMKQQAEADQRKAMEERVAKLKSRFEVPA